MRNLLITTAVLGLIAAPAEAHEESVREYFVTAADYQQHCVEQKNGEYHEQNICIGYRNGFRIGQMQETRGKVTFVSGDDGSRLQISGAPDLPVSVFHSIDPETGRYLDGAETGPLIFSVGRDGNDPDPFARAGGADPDDVGIEGIWSPMQAADFLELMRDTTTGIPEAAAPPG